MGGNNQPLVLFEERTPNAPFPRAFSLDSKESNSMKSANPHSGCRETEVARTIDTMLMYGKEASDRKQEIDRQHHTIPNQKEKRPKDKHCGNVHNRLWNHG